MREFFVVTGASSGIGYALCCHLAKCNKAVIAIARRQERLNILKNEHPKLISTIVADLGVQADRDKVVAQIATEGTLLGVVNNAATNEPVSLLEELSLVEWQKQIAINVNAPIFLTQALLPFLHSGSKIINLTTGTINFVVTGIASYAMTKAALNAFTKYLSVELSSSGILVAAAHPGIVKTGLVDSIIKRNNPDFGITKAQKKFEKEDKYLDASLSAKFLAWLLLDADDSLYTGDVIGIYNKQYQPLWCDTEIPSPYPDGIEPP